MGTVTLKPSVFARVGEFLKRLWFNRSTPKPLAVSTETTPEATDRLLDNSFDDGSGWTLGKLLKNLDETFGDMKMFQKKAYGRAEPHARRMLKTVGPHIVSPSGHARHDRIDLRYLPGFSFVAFHDPEGPKKVSREESICPVRFMWAMKHDYTPSGVERREGVLYAFGGAMEVPETKKLSWLSFWGVVNPDSGKIEICRQRVRRDRHIKLKHGWQEIPTRQWVTPQLLDANNKPLDLTKTLASVLNFWMTREFSWNVYARKDDLRCSFVIPQNDAPRFFSRGDLRAKDGLSRRRPVYHAVKSHYRKKKGKGHSIVKTHYRGLRRFKWGAYSVTINIPGKNVPALSTWEEGAMSEQQLANEGIKGISAVRAARMMAKMWE